MSSTKFRVQGSGFRGSGFRVKGLGTMVGLRVNSYGFIVLRFTV